MVQVGCTPVAIILLRERHISAPPMSTTSASPARMSAAAWLTNNCGELPLGPV
ncbi:Uncharacterised protein [Mycobacteroides abscessus subsp. abscessus]|nr:Uncharacterised protein [Mycobacteroides abscessus subsp. abscessus]